MVYDVNEVIESTADIEQETAPITHAGGVSLGPRERIALEVLEGQPLTDSTVRSKSDSEQPV